MMNKKVGIFVFAALLVVLSLSMAFALHNPNHNPGENGNPHDDINNSTNSTNSSSGGSGGNSSNNSSNSLKIRKINYGLCVSNATLIKNDCYKQVKDTYELCRNNSFNTVLNNYTNFSNPQFNEANINDKAKKNRYKFINLKETRELLKDCRFTFTTELRECKQEFKENKAQCNMFKCKDNQTFVNGTCVRQ